MSAGFSHGGSLVGTPPVPLVLDVGETCYQGQIVQDNLIAGTGGHVQIADVASEAHEDDLMPVGVVASVEDGSRTYSATYYGDGSTYTTTQATVLANGHAQVKVNTIDPMSLIKGPIFNAAYGTALDELTITTASSGGTAVTHANDTITDIADDLGTVYCRKGANRGEYRIVTTGTTTAQTVTVPFPVATVVGDIFVMASCKLGLGAIDWPATANCIDGNNDLNAYYDVYGYQLNLEESAKEKFVFRFCAKALDGATT